MPKQLIVADIESGRAKMMKSAMEKSTPAKSEMSGAMKEMTAAVKHLATLHTLTQAVLDRQGLPPASTTEILDKLAEIQFLTQQTMESLREAIILKQADPPMVPCVTMRDIDLKVTERDAWGRIMSIKGHLETK
jgi:hypothetical protein